jgi:hypothetical protein
MSAHGLLAKNPYGQPRDAELARQVNAMSTADDPATVDDYRISTKE